ncbi:MAG TPA: bifunctional phosphoglucose/phosphomannose isomerase [Solirubrobacterales bacterium]|nr:bifunctional phosphoglucose/phosphomannose isomerase [Solirubrobacterales bacterium]
MSGPDAEGMRDNVRAIPDHLRDALWRIESARLQATDAPAAIVCGMGGSAIGGDLAAAALGDRLARPLVTVRGYGLPSWSPAGSAVLCSSYSGDTEETLACFDAAEALGAQRIVATTGGQLAESARAADVPVVGLPSGMPPRAAVGYMFAVAAEHARLCGAAPGLRTEIDSTAAHLEARRDALAERAAEIAERIGDATPVIHGADLTAPAAYRWKCQVNENAKLPALWSVLPEANHNEIASWGESGGRLAAVMLTDSDQHPRIHRRFEASAAVVGEGGAEAIAVEVEGETRTARLLELVMLGDLVSLELAARRGVDPTPIEAIEGLKAELGAP